jgi:RNA polymerase sigma factor (sigma-70 family)
MSTDIAPDEPWLGALRAGDPDRGWDLFIGHYRALIFASIRHYTRDHDQVMDVFTEVCSALRRDSLGRLTKYWDRPTHTARFSTWLVTVVRHLVIDWARRHIVQRRPRLPLSLSSLQQQIFDCIFVERRSHAETYELVHATTEPRLSLGAYARELRAIYRAVDANGRTQLLREMAGPGPLLVGDLDVGGDDAADPAVLLDTRLRIANALNALKPDERLAVEMFVVHEMPAAAIARALGWPNAKAVYNHVYRALATMRVSLKRKGIEREDL